MESASIKNMNIFKLEGCSRFLHPNKVMRSMTKSREQKLIQLGIMILILAGIILLTQYFSSDPLTFQLSLLIVLSVNVPLGIILIVIGVIRAKKRQKEQSKYKWSDR